MKAKEVSLYEKGDFSEHAKKLLGLNRFKLVLTDHIRLRMLQRQILEKDIKENLNNPKTLFVARKRKESRKNEESYQCYFRQSGHLCHVYGLAFNGFVGREFCDGAPLCPQMNRPLLDKSVSALFFFVAHGGAKCPAL